MFDLEKAVAERSGLMAKWEALNKRAEEAGDAGLSKEDADEVTRIRSCVEGLDAQIEAEGKRLEDEKKALRTRAQADREAFAKAKGRQTPQVFGIVSDLDDRNYQRLRGLALQAWFLGEEGASERHRSAAAEMGLNLRAPLDLGYPGEQIDDAKEHHDGTRKRAAQTITTTGGGHAIATGFVQRFEERLVYYCPIRQYADILTTTEGNPINFPTVDDTSISAADRTINTATSEDAFTLGQVSLSAYGKSTELLVPYELFQDVTLSNFESRLADMLARRHGRKEATDFTTGSGSSAPQGMVTGAGTGKTTASATAIATDEIFDLEASLDPEYRQNAVWFMHSNVWSYVSKLKDSQGRYLVGGWDAFGQGRTRTLLGYPVIFNNAMASSVATTNKTILFCDPKLFTIRQAGQRELIRDTSRFVREDQVLIKMRQRYDSKVVQANAFKLLVQA